MASIKGIKFKNTSVLEIEDTQSRNNITNLTTKINDNPKKTKIENGKIYLTKEDGTKIDTGTELPKSGDAYDDTEIKNNIQTLQDEQIILSVSPSLDKIELV